MDPEPRALEGPAATGHLMAAGRLGASRAARPPFLPAALSAPGFRIINLFWLSLESCRKQSCQLQPTSQSISTEISLPKPKALIPGRPLDLIHL